MFGDPERALGEIESLALLDRPVEPRSRDRRPVAACRPCARPARRSDLPGRSRRLPSGRGFFFNPSLEAAWSCSSCPAPIAGEAPPFGLERRNPPHQRRDPLFDFAQDNLPHRQLYSSPATFRTHSGDPYRRMRPLFPSPPRSFIAAHKRMPSSSPMKLRNVAIIAHVDPGKTTLVDRLLQQSGAFRDNQRVAERVMDSNDLERERGITILAKATSVVWRDVRINIVDTPGHADFGGEVERILSMVDGAIVLVDAAEGPMPQTKFVVGKALKIGLKPIVAINKVDKPDARPTEVINEVFDLFAALDADDEQLDFPILYGSSKQGWMSDSPDQPTPDMSALFDLVLEHVPEPKVEDGGFRMLGTLLESNPYLGRIITGRIFSGAVKPNQAVKVLDRKGKSVEQGRISKILAFRGIERQPIEEAEAGDIVAIAGLEKLNVADTLCAPEVVEPLQAQPIDPPTLSMTFLVNDSPLAGTEGDKVTSRVIRDRLYKEAEGNVALKIEDSPGSDSYIVSGRGE